MVDGVKDSGLYVNMSLSNGDKKQYSLGEANFLGITPDSLKEGQPKWYYYNSDGRDVYTHNIEDLPMSASLDEETGDIVINAPKEIYDTDEFKKVFDEEILKSYSQAYKLNPDYKVSVMDKNEETGAEEEKQITIPDWIERLNKDFEKYRENLQYVRSVREKLREEFGDKVDNFSTTDMNRIMQDPTSGVYIPDILFNVNFFGDNPNLGNPFDSLKGKSGADGSYTLDDLKEVFTRENFGRSELMGVLATIDGALKSSNWDKASTYTDADGNVVKNRNSASEASKLIAFREFIKTNHPASEWYQQIGDNIETLYYNFDYYTTRVFANIADLGESIFNNSSHVIHNWIKEDLDPTMEQYNISSQLETDAAQAMQVIGMIGGTFLGSAGAGVLAKWGIGILASPFTIGASMAIKAMPALQKLTMLSTIAKTFSTAHPLLSASVSFLFDTLHDAVLFDFTTLRDTIEASDGDTKTYWMGQLADNLKWWTGMAGVRTLVKFAGKTPIGKMSDAIITPLINKKAALWGDRKAAFYDKMAGGSLLRKIEDKMLNTKQGSNKWNRLAKKHVQLEFDEILRDARRGLGEVDVKWKFGKNAKEGYQELLNAKVKVMQVENAIDSYARNINYTVGEWILPQYDPATKQMRFINPDLAKANQNASDFYWKLSSLAKKYNMPLSDQGFLNQNMVDYWVGSVHLETMTNISKYGNADNSKKALEAIPIIQRNVEAAKNALPDEIVMEIDRGIRERIYQKWYKSQNEFAKHNKLIEEEKIDSYDNNPIWKDTGYMPANIKTDPTGTFRRKDGTVDAVISQDIEHFTYDVNDGQHYADPELVRFNKLRALAKAKVNRDVLKAYTDLTSVKHVVKISGEETEYARRINDNRKALERLLEVSATEQFKPGAVEFKLTKNAKGEKTLTTEIDFGTRTVVISSLSPDDVTEFLKNKKVIKGADGKISDNVNADNYDEWFKAQSEPVQNYLIQRYAELTGSDVIKTPNEAEKLMMDRFDGARKQFEQHSKVNAVEMLSSKNWEDQRNGKSFLEFQAKDVFRVRKYENKYGRENVPKDLLEKADSVEENLRKAGYTIEDWTGRPYREGLNVEILEVEDAAKSAPEDTLYIKEVVDPAIIGPDGKLFSKPVVVIGSKFIDNVKTDMLNDAPVARSAADIYGVRLATDEDYPGFRINERDDGNMQILSKLDESNPKATREGTLRDYHRDWNGKEVAVIEMDPGDYNRILNADMPGRGDAIDEDKVHNYAERFRNGERAAIVSLQYDSDGKIIGQEGRNRSAGAKEAGIEKIPVLVEYRAGMPPDILYKYDDVTDRFVLRPETKVEEVDGNDYAKYIDTTKRGQFNPEGYKKFGEENLERVSTDDLDKSTEDLATIVIRTGGPVDKYNAAIRSGEIASDRDFAEYLLDDFFDLGGYSGGINSVEEELEELAWSYFHKDQEALYNKFFKNVGFDDTNEEEYFDALRELVISKLVQGFRGNYKLKNNTILYRGINAGGNRVNRAGDLSWVKPNSDFNDRGFAFVTLSRDAANRFAGSGDGEKILLEYHVPAGNKVFYLNEYGKGARDGGAMILPSNSSGRIGDITVDENGVKHVQVYLDSNDVEPMFKDKFFEYGVAKPEELKNVNIKPKYKLEKIIDGSYDGKTRWKLAKTATVEMGWEKGQDNTRGIVLYRNQDKLSDGVEGHNNADYDDLYFKTPGDIQKMQFFGLDKPKSLSKAATKNMVIFPVRYSDIMQEGRLVSIQRAAKRMIENGDIYQGPLAKADELTLEKIANGDIETILKTYGKKCLVADFKDSSGKTVHGVMVFDSDAKKLFDEGTTAMSKTVNNIENVFTLSPSAYANYRQKNLDKLLKSKKNLEFLNQLGWSRINSTFNNGKKRWAGMYKPDWDRILINAKFVDNLAELMSVEFHEITHAVWERTNTETKKAIAQDLINILGIKELKVDNYLACTEEMNELIAHAMETRFQTKHGWDVMRNDDVVLKHIDKLATYAGYYATPSFKDKVLNVLRGFVTFVKTKFIGVNSAKTFDEFYYGLLNGRFADDLALSPRMFLDRDMDNYISLMSDDELAHYQSTWPLDILDASGDNRKIDIEDLSSETSDLSSSINIKKEPLRIPVNAGSLESLVSIPTEVPVNIVKKPNSYDLFKQAMENGGDEFEAGLQRAYLLGDKAFAKSPLMNEAARNVADGKEAFYEGVVLASIKGEMKKLVPDMDVDTFSDDLLNSIRNHVDSYVDKITTNEGAKKVIAALASETNGADAFARYFTLKKLAEKDNLDKAKATMASAVWSELHGRGVTIEKGEKMLEQVRKLVGDVVEKELDDATSVLRTINPELVDTKDLFEKLNKLNKEITGAKRNLKDNFVMYLDDNGREVYAEVSPAFASLYNYRYQIENAEASAMAKVNGLMSRMFRYGTTSVNLASFGNQLFRDFSNAICVGGAIHTWKWSANNLADVYGDTIINQLKEFDPSGYEMRQVEQLAEQSGQTLQQAAVSRELMRGTAYSSSTTETTLYAKFMKEAYGKKTNTDLNNLKENIETLLEKYNPDKLLNGKRENYLRRRVYANAYNDAMDRGFNIQQARTYAEFAMNNATTNFSRQLYHLQAIADSTPYFRAAINGTKSFWRMWSLDPIGITGRITGGLIIPVMALTAFSLENKEDAEIYKNIPEYQKDSSIVFVFDGKPISIPIPQEISNIINPFRHFVEYLHQAQPNSFQELAMNDLLGFVPYDFTGFSTVDMDHMAQDPTFFDRVSRGFARIFSTMAPVPIKSVYMLATGTDPYTGKSLRDPKNNVYYNEETGTTEVMDYNQNAFARLLAEWFGDSGMSSQLAEKLVSGVIGTTGSNILGDITALFREGGDAFIKSAATNIGEQVMKPFDVPVYDLANAVWKREIKNLTFEKEAILNSKKMVTLNNQLKFETDPEKRKKILADRSNLVNDFTNKVSNLVQGLSEKYGGRLDRQKFAAVMNLLNFDSDASYQSGTQASSDIALEGYWDGRDAAIHTMQQLGINGTNDASIFGYLIKDNDTGKTVMKYSSPIAIMDMTQQWYNQDEINYANINALIKNNGIKDAHNAVAKQINAIYNSKSKLTSQDRANIEAIQINWNAQLAKTIAPYVSQMTPEAAINNSKVMNLLYQYVEVPGSWEKNNSNRSPSLGDRGNKKKAYYESWIKSMFSVNDPYKGQY